MKKKLLLAATFASIAFVSIAQRPKLDLKVYAGYHTHIYKYRTEEEIRDVFHGYQGGFGFRVTWREFMGEMNFNFVRSTVRVPVDEDIFGVDNIDFRFNSFEIPLKVGYIPVKTPFFKWYTYTGLGVRFNTRGKFELDGEEYKFKPNEVDLRWANLDFILGTQFDVGPFNFEVLYNAGLTNSIRENIRANSHEIHFNAGIWF